MRHASIDSWHKDRLVATLEPANLDTLEPLRTVNLATSTTCNLWLTRDERLSQGKEAIRDFVGTAAADDVPPTLGGTVEEPWVLSWYVFPERKFFFLHVVRVSLIMV